MSEPDTAARLTTPEGVRAYVRGRLEDFHPTGTPTRLPEGNLNVVWRVPGADRSVILKYAPPHIAVDPETPLDPSRLTIEARCLEALSPSARLAGVGPSSVRPPRRIDLQTEPHVLIMEDCGNGPTLGRWLWEGEETTVRDKAPTIGRRLGEFIGRLHRTTLNDPDCATAFDNRPMQETRLAVQYRGVADMLRVGGVDDAVMLGERAVALGEELRSPGRCLTMGDLWPPSVLVRGDGDLRIIDWELAHYGRPLQDVAHWLAHLWMQRHRAPSEAVADAIAGHRDAFLTAYAEGLGAARDELWDDAERRGAAIHIGAEILVRAVGPFQAGYVYAGLDADHPAVQEAVATASTCLRIPTAVDLFGQGPTVGQGPGSAPARRFPR
ncbi:MAG: phosphotransferase [Salinibacter sp.]|uniref:phosphotransferase family protein n=1 Tax=Salinibacter sp. TaxID=2065818 RepID=UPI002FC38EC6